VIQLRQCGLRDEGSLEDTNPHEALEDATMNSSSSIEILLWTWFALTFFSTAYVAYDLFARTPEMKIMKWGWIAVTLYIGPVAFVLYWLSCREPANAAHETFIVPLWKQAVGSTIHCVAGDATGIIVAATITSLLGLPMGIDMVVEYAAGFVFGLLIFQALFLKVMVGGSYWQAVKTALFPEGVSMNAMMAGMFPVMAILMTRDMQSMEPTGAHFWAIMSLATLVGAAFAYPVNWWLVASHLKHGMGTERVLGKGGSKIAPEHSEMKTMGGGADAMDTDRSSTAAAAVPGTMAQTGGVSAARKVAVALVTIVLLAGGAAIAARFGDLSMRAGQQHAMQMK
jgi:hypothetical protein